MGQKKSCISSALETAKKQLVLGSRILANEGFLDCFGHISVRNPDNPCTFLQSRSLSADMITLDDIMEIDLDGNVVSDLPTAKPYWERFLHARVMYARPDICAVYHGHPREIIPFTVMPDIPLLPVKNSGGVFYNGFGYYTSHGTDMTVSSVAEANSVAQALGDKWAVLMRGHGVTVGAENIPQLVLDVISLCQNAAIYLDCLKIGKMPVCCTPEEGLAYRISHHAEGPLSRNWDYYVRRAKKNMSDIDFI